MQYVPATVGGHVIVTPTDCDGGEERVDCGAAFCVDTGGVLARWSV